MGLDAIAFADVTVIDPLLDEPIPESVWAQVDERDDRRVAAWQDWWPRVTEGFGLPVDPARDKWHHALLSVGARGPHHSMPYSSYRRFRDDLAKLSGHLSFQMMKPEDPFALMCQFSDCDGFFSTTACKTIAADFRAHRDRYLAANPDDIDRYDDWAELYRYAADNNGIVYHT